MSTPIEHPNTSSTLNKQTLLKQVFTDYRNYPYGFSRSGDFSIAESKALSSFGCYFEALIAGHLPAVSQDELDFIAVSKGESEPTTTAQRAWLRYQKRINRPKTVSIHGCKKVERNDTVDVDTDVDIDDNIDIDID